jgi:hypothetical protein
MVKIPDWFSPKPKTGEDLAAQQQAKVMRDSMETQRTGALDGAPGYTHGGKDSR